jgi:pimeloyl-ACP methyl ester carboxylesterase
VTLAESAGPFAAAIGHSFGGVCLASAVRAKLKVDRLVLFSTPSNLIGMIDKYCRTLCIWRPARARLVRAIEDRLASVELEREFDVRAILQSTGLATLVIHDRKDSVVPFSECEELSRAGTNEPPVKRILPSVTSQRAPNARHQVLVRQESLKNGSELETFFMPCVYWPRTNAMTRSISKKG